MSKVMSSSMPDYLSQSGKEGGVSLPHDDITSPINVWCGSEELSTKGESLGVRSTPLYLLGKSWLYYTGQ